MRKPKNTAPPREPLVQVPEGADADLYDDVEDARAENAPLTELLATLGATGGDAKVVVQRVSTVNGQRREEWLFNGAPSDSLQEDLQAHYGAGEYRIRVYCPGVLPNGKRYMDCLANKTIYIGPSRVPTVPLAATAPAIDPARLIADAVAAMSKELLAIIGPVLNTGNTRASIIADLKGFAEVLAPARAAPASGLDSPEKIVSLISQVLAMSKSLQGERLPVGEDGDVGDNALLVKGLESFMEIVRAAKGAPAPGTPAPLALNAPAPVAGTPAPIANLLAQPEDEEMLMLKLFIARLLRAAAANEPVEEHAARVAALVGDDVLDQLESPQWFAEVLKIAPDAARYPEWFARLRDAVLKSFEEIPIPVNGHSPAAPAKAA